METDVIKPFVGAPPTPENFAQSFPQIEASIVKGANSLDATSQANLTEFLRQMRSNPPRPATIVNLHPWPLQLPASKFTRGIVVPACVPGQEFAHTYVRGWIKDWKQDEQGSLQFMAVNPIHRATEFLREFSLGDAFGPGVIVYEGETRPDKAAEVETYSPNGLPNTTIRDGYDYDEENRKVPTKFTVPVTKDFQKILKETTAARNAAYLRNVRRADNEFRRPDGKGKGAITPFIEMMAEVLVAEGLLEAMPDWKMASKLEKGLAEENCPACGASYKNTAFRCGGCSHILNPLEAYKNGAIEFGHVSMDKMTAEEWEEATTIKDERTKARAKANLARARAAKEAKEGEQSGQ